MRNKTKRNLAKPPGSLDVVMRRTNSTICQIRQCLITIPADTEQEWRNGNRDALAEVLTQEVRRLARQIAEDYDAQMLKQMLPGVVQ